MMDILSLILSGDLQWDALDQSRMNSVLLALIVILFGGLIWALKSFATKFYGEVEKALEEIKEIKLSIREHDVEIENLKEDMGALLGRKRHNR